MIFNREKPEVYHVKNKMLVEKWERQFKAKREKLKPQWKAECQWHAWFAWRPVEVGTYEEPKTAWLEWIERRLENIAEMPTIQATWNLRKFIYRIPK